MNPPTLSAHRRAGFATGLGLVAVLLWGTSVAVNRLIAEQIGLVGGPLLSTAVSGGVGVIVLAARPGEGAKLARLPVAFWAICGTLFVAYILAYNLGIGLARNGRQLLLFGILNYLWPVLTIAFSAVFFPRRLQPGFFVGLALAAAAVALAFLARPGGAGDSAASLDLAGVAEDLRSNPPVFVLGLFCGVAWALYSNLGRKIAGPSEANPVPLLFLAASVAFAAAWLAGVGRWSASAGDAARWDAASVAALAWRALLVDLAAYSFWDMAMRRGRQLAVAVASLFTPLLSTAAIALVVEEAPGPLFWSACLVAIGGAALCRLSAHDHSG